MACEKEEVMDSYLSQNSNLAFQVSFLDDNRYATDHHIHIRVYMQEFFAVDKM